MKQFVLATFFFAFSQTHAGEIVTNSVHMADAPAWVKRTRVDKIIDHIQMVLEWDIRRIEVHWYNSQAAFEKAHSLGPAAMAVSKSSDNTIHLGPRVDNSNFDAVFGHELVHIISYQKYKDAISAWLEEGLANHLAKQGKVDYRWLARKPFPPDVRKLVHPFDAATYDDIRYHYVMSQALVEMIASKCDLSNLLRLSVGKKMDDYLDTYCEINDLNEAYRKWVKKRGA